MTTTQVEREYTHISQRLLAQFFGIQPHGRRASCPHMTQHARKRLPDFRFAIQPLARMLNREKCCRILVKAIQHHVELELRECCQELFKCRASGLQAGGYPKYFSKIWRAIGAANVEPSPMCSIITTTAILGLSAGA
jgi:hypothetical protein